MRHPRDPTANPDDPLDRLANELRSLRPREASEPVRRGVARQLETPRMLRRRPRVLAIRLSAAASLAAVVTLGWAILRPDPSGRPGPAVETEAIQAGGPGCECRVRFLPRPPARAALATPATAAWRA